MKKTIIVLMALAGMAIAADNVAWTLSNGDVIGGGQRYSRNSIIFTLTDAGNSYSAVPSAEGAEFSTYHQLESITLQARGGFANGVQGVLMTGDKTIIATTISGSLKDEDKVQALTFDFSGTDVVLEKGQTYTLAFAAYDKVITLGTTASSAANDYVKPALFVIKNEGSIYDTTDLKYNNMEGSSENYIPGITIVTKAIPEPTTATLSLLALAGLAARRRRK